MSIRWCLAAVGIAIVVGGLPVDRLEAGPAAAPAITLQAPAAEGSAGATVDVAISATGATRIAALETTLVYDPAILAFESLTPGALVEGASIVSNGDTPGRLGISVATAREIGGDGTLATVRFAVIGQAGQASTLDFENTAAWEAEHLREVQVATQPGSVTVVAGFPIGWIALLIGLAVLVLLVLLFFARRKRRPTPAPASHVPLGDTPGRPPSPAGGAHAQAEPRAPSSPVQPQPPVATIPTQTTAAPAQQGATCGRCGTANRPGSSFCSKCGALLPRPNPPSNP